MSWNQPIIKEDSFKGDMINAFFLRPPYRKPRPKPDKNTGENAISNQPTHTSKDFEEGPPSEQDGLGVA